MSELKDLFEVPIQPSPRMAWLAKNKLRTERNPDYNEGFTEDEFGNDIFEYYAIHDNQLDKAVGGETPEIAIINWATQSGIPLWNEQEFANKKFAPPCDTKPQPELKNAQGGGAINFDINV